MQLKCVDYLIELLEASPQSIPRRAKTLAENAMVALTRRASEGEPAAILCIHHLIDHHDPSLANLSDEDDA
jgi:hypothetical protein